jgi:hypothetical protein
MKTRVGTGRDYAMVALIKGATKAGAHLDRRAEAKRRACRGSVRKLLRERIHQVEEA